MEVQGIWDEEDEMLKSAVAVWGILPKGMNELKKRVLEDNVISLGVGVDTAFCTFYDSGPRSPMMLKL